MTISSCRLPIILALIIILIFASSSLAQITIQYEKSLSDEFPYGISDWTIDDQGNVYLVGITLNEISVPAEITLLKISQEGEIEWQEDLVLPLSRPSPFHLAIDTDGNLIVAGYSTEAVFDGDHWITTEAILSVNKYDPDGNELWGGPISHNQELTWGVYIRDMVVNDAGFIFFYIDDSSNLNLALLYKISPTGLLTTTNLGYAEYMNLLAIPGSVLATNIETNEVYCQDVDYPYDEWYLVEDKAMIIDLESDPSIPWFGPLSLHSCVMEECNDHLPQHLLAQTLPWEIARCASSGNIVMSSFVNNYCPDQGYNLGDDRYFINVISSNGEEVDLFETCGELRLVDNQDNLILYCDNWPDYNAVKLTPTGEVMWDRIFGGRYSSLLAVDDDNYIYGKVETSYQTALSCLNPDNGETEWSCPVFPYDGAASSSIRIDSEKRIYMVLNYAPVTVAVYDREKKLAILDGSENNDPIANTKFWLIRMQNDIPNLTEDTLGQFTTDANGEFELNIIDCGEFEFVHDLYNGSTSDIISVGDSLKIAKCLDVEAAVKHTDVLGTAYSIHLDNAKFDDVGVITFDSLDNMAVQEIIMDHTEVRYNLTVRVQWEARRDYLEALEDHFRYMSNYLYDVFDGQLRLDTIMIYDYSNPEQWEPSDIKIHSSNQVWPYCDPFTGNGPPVSYDILQGYASINLPRWFKGNPSNPAASEADVRDYSRTDYPYTVYNSDMHRTFAHEFGHYALRFEDEYIRIPNGAPRCEPFPSGNYGFMDSHYERDISGSFSSEMSNEYKYELAECQTTRQFVRYNKSCWDYFETRFEQVYYGLDFLDEIWAPIKKPHHDNENERLIPSGQKGYSGPNSLLGPDPSYLNYNVGNLIVFPETPVDPPVDIIDMEVTVYNSSGNLPNIDVTLNRRIDGLIIGRIPQGKTALGDPPSYTIKGEIIVLGTGPDDDIDACGHAYIAVPATKLSNSVKYEKQWFSGTIDLSTVSEDSVSLQLEPLSGSYPLIIYGNLSESSLLYTMNVDKAFPELPTALICPGYEYDTTMDMTENGNSYQADIQTDLGSDGVVVIHAEDSLHQPFFFETPYNIVSREENDSTFLLYTNDGTVIQLDSTNTAVDRIMTMRSSFPVPLGGLDDASLQVSDAYSILVYPDQQFLGGNSIRIPYSDELADSTGKGFTEENISVFRWDLLNSEWIDIGGYINADYNYIIASIEGPGVYAAFATDFVLDVEDDEHGNILPYRFELSQNYPNPFNPVTTISYSLPRRSEVSIDIFNILGQKIITLVDETKPAGDYQINWDSNDSYGQKVSTGIYFYRFQAGDYIETKKMILLK